MLQFFPKFEDRKKRVNRFAYTNRYGNSVNHNNERRHCHLCVFVVHERNDGTD